LEPPGLHQEVAQGRHVGEEENPLHEQADSEVDPEEIEAEISVGLDLLDQPRELRHGGGVYMERKP
jgi:hypothetical protein